MAFCCSMSEILTNVSVIISACLHERRATQSHLPSKNTDSAQGIVDLGFATVIGSGIFQFTMTVAVVCYALPNGYRLKMWQISRDLLVQGLGVMQLTFCLSDSRVEIRDAFVLLMIWTFWLMQIMKGDRRRYEVEEAQEEHYESTTLISIHENRSENNKFMRVLQTIFVSPVEQAIDRTFLDISTLEPLDENGDILPREEYAPLKENTSTSSYFELKRLPRLLSTQKVAKLKELLNMVFVVVAFSFLSQ